MGQKLQFFPQYLVKEMEIKNSPWCPKLYQPKLHRDTKYSTINDSVWAVEGGASDFGPSSRYNNVRSVDDCHALTHFFPDPRFQKRKLAKTKNDFSKTKLS